MKVTLTNKTYDRDSCVCDVDHIKNGNNGAICKRKYEKLVDYIHITVFNRRLFMIL